jgi:hypothetical protein
MPKKYSGYGKARTAVGRSRNQRVSAGGGADGS